MFSAASGPRLEREINEGPFQARTPCHHCVETLVLSLMWSRTRAQTAAQYCGVDEDALFKRLRVSLDKPGFAFQTFQPTQVVQYGDSTPGEVVVVTGCAHTVSQCLRLTGPGQSQTGAAWFTTRKTVSRGFTTRFRFVVGTAVEAAAAATRRGRDEAPAVERGRSLTSMMMTSQPMVSGGFGGRFLEDAKTTAPWVWGGGFSFVVQGAGVNAAPSVSRVEPSAAQQPGSSGAGAGGGGVDSGSGDAVRYDGVPMSLEIQFHVDPEGRRNHIAVYLVVDRRAAGRSDADMPTVRHLVGHTHGLQGLGEAGPHLAATGVPRMGDGREHTVEIEYKAPSTGAGELRVYVDQLTQPALVTDVRMDKEDLRLDGASRVRVPCDRCARRP